MITNYSNLQNKIWITGLVLLLNFCAGEILSRFRKVRSLRNGGLKKRGRSMFTSRGVNWDESSNQYPWIVLVERETFANWEKSEIDGEEDERIVEPGACGGAFISSKLGLVITAAHCICNYDDMGVNDSPIRCLPQDENQIQRPEDNDLYIRMGSNNREEGIEIDCLSAFVMHVVKRKVGEKEYIELQANPDIGIIRADVQSIRENKLNIQALRLPNKDENYIDRHLKVVSWGTTYDESDVTIDEKKVTISSCVTGPESLPENQFMPCNVHQIRENNGCFQWPPPDPDYTSRCEKAWEELKNSVAGDMSNGLKRVTALKVISSSKDGSRIETHCINPEIIQKKGWCETIESSDEKKKWGICSPSCQFLKHTPQSPLEKGQEVKNDGPFSQNYEQSQSKWDIDESTGAITPKIHHERIVKLTLCPSETHISKFAWNLCVTPRYPEYAILNIKDDNLPTFEYFEKNDALKVEKIASRPSEKLRSMGIDNFYQGFSWGDCGSPVWDEKSKTLVAVVRGGVAPPDTEIVEKVPSGYNIDFVTTINYAKVHEFINSVIGLYS